MVSEKSKVAFAYVMTFVLFVLNVSVTGKSNLMEIWLRKRGVRTFYTNGYDGLYYPTLFLMGTIMVFWLLLKKYGSESKFAKDYLYNCFILALLAFVVQKFIIGFF